MVRYIVFTYSKSKCNADDELNRMFKILSSQENDIVRPRTITHLGRDVTFDKTCGQVLFSSFDHLCDRVCAYRQLSAYSNISETIFFFIVERSISV